MCLQRTQSSRQLVARKAVAVGFCLLSLSSPAMLLTEMPSGEASAAWRFCFPALLAPSGGKHDAARTGFPNSS